MKDCVTVLENDLLWIGDFTMVVGKGGTGRIAIDAHLAWTPLRLVQQVHTTIMHIIILFNQVEKQVNASVVAITTPIMQNNKVQHSHVVVFHMRALRMWRLQKSVNIMWTVKQSNQWT